MVVCSPSAIHNGFLDLRPTLGGNRIERSRPPTRRLHLGIWGSLGSAHLGNETESTEVLIVGAGVAGLATSLALQKVGISSLVLEKAQGIRDGGAALSLWGNAWRALDALGVAERLRPKFVPLKRLKISDFRGVLLRDIEFDECSGGPHEVRGVQRGDLLLALSTDLPPETIRFDSQITSIQRNLDSNICVSLKNGKKFITKVLVGCDGASSIVANWLGLSKINYLGYAAYRGVALLPNDHPILKTENTIRMVWGKGIRAGAYPLTDKLVYWFTCFNRTPGSRESDPEKRKTDAMKMVGGWAFDIEGLISNTPASSISYSDLGDRWISSFPRWGNKNVTLAGDAAHPMTPNLGQGACTSLEDAIIFARELSKLKSATNSMDVTTLDEGSSGRLGDHVSLTSSLEAYERERTIRCLPLQIRSSLMGTLLQSPYDMVCFLRDSLGVRLATNEDHFLDHTLYDCGKL